MDWFTRKVLAWRISNTLEADFCIEALNEAVHRFDPPAIMNTDRGSPFTSFAWTDRLKRTGTRISMDGKGHCLDNIFIERLWRSLRYECVYLHDGRLARRRRRPLSVRCQIGITSIRLVVPSFAPITDSSTMRRRGCRLQSRHSDGRAERRPALPPRRRAVPSVGSGRVSRLSMNSFATNLPIALPGGARVHKSLRRTDYERAERSR